MLYIYIYIYTHYNSKFALRAGDPRDRALEKKQHETKKYTKIQINDNIHKNNNK